LFTPGFVGERHYTGGKPKDSSKFVFMRFSTNREEGMKTFRTLHGLDCIKTNTNWESIKIELYESMLDKIKQ